MSRIVKEKIGDDMYMYTCGEINYSQRNGFYMEHQCDDWVIGNLDDAENFNEDLQTLIEYVKTYSLQQGGKEKEDE